MNIDLSTTLGSLTLPNPIIGASGSFGHSDELFDVINPDDVGAITIKSLAAFVSPGNQAPRVGAVATGMMNSVGLPGPHIQEWVDTDFKKIRDANGRFIMALWGRTVEEYAEAARILAPVSDSFVAIEINLSCPNTESGNRLFAQSYEDTQEIVKRVRKEVGNDVVLTTKLTPAVTRVTEIAQAAIAGGTDILTLFNTVLGLALDPYTRKPIVGKGAGGYSGAGVLPIAQKGVYEVHQAFPDTPIIGTGGVTTGVEAAGMMMCGASAVGVATATFADPRATIRIADELKEFCYNTGVARVTDLIGAIDMPA